MKSKVPWFWAARDTSRLIDRVRRWRGDRVRNTRAPKTAAADTSWELAIAISRADTATSTCRLIVRTNKPACLLIPSDLVYYVPQNMDGTFDKDAANLTWLCFNVPDAPAHLVYTTEILADYMPPHIPDEHAATIGTLVQWAAEQPSSLTTDSKYINVRCVGTADAGLKTYIVADVPRIYVPISRRRPLFDYVHDAINHMADLKTYHELTK